MTKFVFRVFHLTGETCNFENKYRKRIHQESEKKWTYNKSVRSYNYLRGIKKIIDITLIYAVSYLNVLSLKPWNYSNIK